MAVVAKGVAVALPRQTSLTPTATRYKWASVKAPFPLAKCGWCLAATNCACLRTRNTAMLYSQVLFRTDTAAFLLDAILTSSFITLGWPTLRPWIWANSVTTRYRRSRLKCSVPTTTLRSTALILLTRSAASSRTAAGALLRLPHASLWPLTTATTLWRWAGKSALRWPNRSRRLTGSTRYCSRQTQPPYGQQTT